MGSKRDRCTLTATAHVWHVCRDRMCSISTVACTHVLSCTCLCTCRCDEDRHGHTCRMHKKVWIINEWTHGILGRFLLLWLMTMSRTTVKDHFLRRVSGWSRDHRRQISLRSLVGLRLSGLSTDDSQVSSRHTPITNQQYRRIHSPSTLLRVRLFPKPHIHHSSQTHTHTPGKTVVYSTFCFHT